MLLIHLPMFRSSFQSRVLIKQAVTALQSSSHEVKLLFCEVEKLFRSTTIGAAGIFM